MKLAVIASLAAAALAQKSSSSLSAYEKCLEDTCADNKNDVSCQAACLGNPNPNPSMISEANECYLGCDGLDYQAAIDCHTKCNLIYNPTGSVITGHPPAATHSSDKASDTSNSDNDAEDSGASDSDSSEDTKDSDDTTDTEDSKDSDGSGNDGEDTDTGAASALTASLAVAAAVAVAALF
ncbi:hypothetical protein COEREDRAFT_90130 [Coemansia reversa NRRL 1564]|uniref:Extracellular membrane protein CFEM domain-containing protein n=1 Tax=Coemansia reversa (strain ATCC 12441 / NRRL 1564) TaxID=763665 RepID=A0A2G5B0U9_COERN|nr:hypothetical protein COEREDRAFT_90130 [Coemansia reversa NRRL 1564]|eukprot:PIA12645.1 hypothetical protein COEREDRAFT_90130 [Coemansia reversa NRRL 1564]